MPLATCPDCQQRISHAAPACDHCVRPATRPPQSSSRRRGSWGHRLAEQEKQRTLQRESVVGIALLAYGLLKLVLALLDGGW